MHKIKQLYILLLLLSISFAGICQDNQASNQKKLEKKGTKPTQLSSYRGSNPATDKKKERQKTSRETSSYEGNKVPKQPQRTSKEVTNDQGKVTSGSLEKRTEERKDKNREIASNEGSIKAGTLEARAKMRQEKAQQTSNYKGDIGGNYLSKRANFRKEQNKKTSNYSGDILSRTLERRNQRMRNKSHEMATYQGDIIVTGRRKGQHPSAVYRGGKIKNSYSAKEKYRKRMLKKFGKQRDVERPEEQKETKPRYDRKEANIWAK